MANFTWTGFLLLGLSANHELEIIYASLFLVLYLVSLAGNILIITLTSIDESLYSPMYFFLKHLSLLDLCYISVTVPKFIYNTYMQSGIISLWECVLQCFAFIGGNCVELAILTIMSCDRYVAICLPLHYDIIMNVRTCVHGVLGAWVYGAISGLIHAAATFSIHFCRPRVIHQFFCDVPQILKLSCSNDYMVEVGIIAFSASISFLCFIFIGFSYTNIFSTVLRMPSAEGRAKVFSTCLPHLTVVILYVSTGAFDYLKPNSDTLTALDMFLTIMYTVVPPALNPIIYSLRNKAIKSAVRKICHRRKKALTSIQSQLEHKFNM